MQYKIALIVGRFQPFHKGHLFLIKKALEKANKIIIGIGSSNIHDRNNPIDFETRKKIIKAVAYKEKFEERLTKIVPLDDFFDDKKWLDNLKKQVGEFDLALGNNDWTNNILKKAGYKVLKVNYYKRNLFEGWRIRKLIKEGKKWQNRVPEYLINFVSDYTLHPTTYNHIVLGGTFDHFHAGHKALLEKAFKVGKKITIGIATEEIYKDKFLSETVEPFKIRKKSVGEFLRKKSWLLRAKLISFSHFTGGVDNIKNIEAIVVSKQTYSNALKINQLRGKNKLPLLKIIIIDDILAEDGKLISSERIRLGEIDRNGHAYNLPTTTYNLSMPESFRPILQKPLGKIYKTTKQLLRCIDTSKHTLTIAVGDIIVDSLLKSGIDPDVKIIDFRSRRRVIPAPDETRGQAPTGLYINKTSVKSRLINNPGTVNLETSKVIKEKIKLALYKKTKSWIVIEGEEDLLALPAILFAPLNSLVLYGHWQLGIIAVEVDEKIKNKVKNIVNKFL